MCRRLVRLACIASILAIAHGCSAASGTPTSPSPAAASSDAAADGSTLKVTVPTAQAPIGGVRIDSLKPTFRVQNASARYTTTPTLTYRFEVQTMAGVVVATSISIAAGGGTTSWVIPFDLALDTRYRWRARAEMNGKYGPWSGFAEFLTVDYRGLS
jgi:hypothetical protein